MCVIVHQPQDAWIDKETARKLWKANPDGGGFAFVDDNNTLRVVKAMSFKAFWSEFEQARSEHGRRDYLLHMRIATHGAIDLDNVHPFQVDDSTVMAHNGIIHGVTSLLPKDNSVSDTRYFVDNLLPQLPSEWLDSPFMTTLVEEYIGWSKLMFITTSDKLDQTIYRLGEWQTYDGMYMTNLNGLVEKTKKAKTTTFTKGGGSTVYSEGSENWNDWWEYQMIGGDFKEWEVDMFVGDMERERASMYISHDIVTLDAQKLEFQCSGCLAEIDTDTAECGCWEKACVQCWNWVATCQCSVRNVVDFENLTQQGKERLYAAANAMGNNDEGEQELAEIIDIASVVDEATQLALPTIDPRWRV